MPYFEVTIRDARNAAITKTLSFDAASADIARQAATTPRWKPINTRQIANKPPGARTAKIRPLKGKPLVRFCKSVGSMIKNGVPLTDALYFYGDGETDPGLRVAIEGIRNRLKEGGEDPDAAFSASGRFDALFTGIVKAGSTGGVLGESFRAVAEHVQTQITLRGKLKKALLMPTIAIGVILMVFIGSQMKFVPQIEKTVKDTGVEPDPFSSFIFGLSHVVQFVGPILILLGIASILTLVFSKKVRSAVSRGLMKYWGLFRRMIYGFQQLLVVGTMDMLVSNKIGVESAVRAASGVVADEPLGRQLIEIATRYKSGATSLGDGLAKYTSMDKLVSHMVRAGEQTGTLEPQLKLLVATYKEQTDDAVEAFLTAASLVSVIVGAVLIGFTFIANMFPLIMLGPRLMESGLKH